MKDQRRNIINLIDQYQDLNKELDQRGYEGLQPYSLKGSSQAQEEALRSMAKQSGFENLRGFSSWLKASHLDYYDLIKIASPE